MKPRVYLPWTKNKRRCVGRGYLRAGVRKYNATRREQRELVDTVLNRQGAYLL